MGLDKVRLGLGLRVELRERASREMVVMMMRGKDRVRGREINGNTQGCMNGYSARRLKLREAPNIKQRDHPYSSEE